MVAITVILAAVIGAFVLDLGDQLGDSTPAASYDIDNVDATNDEIELTKTGGGDIAFSDLRLVVEANSSTIEYDLASLSGASGDDWRTADTAVITTNSGPDLTVRGATITSSDSTIDFSAGDDVTITVVHKPSGGAVAETSSTA